MATMIRSAQCGDQAMRWAEQVRANSRIRIDVVSKRINELSTSKWIAQKNAFIETRFITTIENAVNQANQDRPHIVLLDIDGQYGIDAQSLSGEKAKFFTRTRRLVGLTRKIDAASRIRAERVGCRDIFSFGDTDDLEILVRAFLRRNQSGGFERIVDLGNIHIDEGARRIIAGKEIELRTTNEFNLIATLSERIDYFWTPPEIKKLMAGSLVEVSDHAVRKMVARARQALGKYSEAIVTVRNSGYKLSSQVQKRSTVTILSQIQ